MCLVHRSGPPRTPAIPAGVLVGINSTAGGSTLAFADQHDDLAGTFTPAGTALASSTTYGPWGQVIAATGPAVEIGYQGQWTDPLTGQVNMGSRFYSPSKGSFLNKDTAPSGGSAYAYADDNPVSLTDPSGHSPSGDSSGAGQITQAEVDQAKNNASNLRAKADRLEQQAKAARNTAAQDQAALSAATSYATRMNNKKAQAGSAWTQAQNEASAAYQEFVADLGGYASLSALSAAVAAALNAAVYDNEEALKYAAAIGFHPSAHGDICVIPIGAPAGAPCEGPGADSYYANLEIKYLNLSTGEYKLHKSLSGQYTKANEAYRQYQADERKANALWKAYQAASSNASAADEARSRAQDTYNEAAASASQLTQRAAAAEKAANTAEDYYKKLKQEYDEQQKPKPKPGPPPRCGPWCIGPFPQPIIPQPVGSLPGSGPGVGAGPGTGPGSSPPGETQTPSLGGGGQGSGSGGSQAGTGEECPDPDDGVRQPRTSCERRHVTSGKQPRVGEPFGMACKSTILCRWSGVTCTVAKSTVWITLLV